MHFRKIQRSGDFGINKLGNVAQLNIHRLIYRPPEVAWNTTTKHLLFIILLPLAPQPIRIQAARVLDEILVIVPRNLSTTGDLQTTVQRQVLDVLAQQIVPENFPGTASTTIAVELRRMGLETLHQILQASGHTLVTGWETIFEMLGSVCKPVPPNRSGSVDSIQVLNTVPALSVGPGNPSEKGYAGLVKIAFQSLTLVCDSVSSLSPDHLRLCISTLGQFGRQADTNIALTAAASLLWSVSDAIQYKRKDVDKEPEYSALWMFLLLEVLGLCTDARPEVRIGAIQTLFRAMQLYGASLSLETWEECIWKVTFPLLDSIATKTRLGTSLSPPSSPATFSAPDATAVPPDQAWDESETLALQSIGSILHDFLVLKIMRLNSFTKTWDVFVSHIQDVVLLDSRTISAPALRCLEKAIKASSVAGFDLKPRVGEVWERVWKTCEQIGDAIVQRPVPESPVNQSAGSRRTQRPFTQESLVAFVDVIRCTRGVSRNIDGVEWPLDRLTRLMAILKGTLLYSFA
jgi:C-terminal region of Mon2 protein